MADSDDQSTESSISENESRISTNGSNGTDTLPIQLTVAKLNEKNYREWTQSIKLVIDGKGKLGYLTGETPRPASTDIAALQKWKLENSLVTAWLVNSMQPSISKTYLFLPTARDVWEAVRETYSDMENALQIFELKTRLWQMKQGERDVTEYSLEMSAIWQELDLSYTDKWKCTDDSARYQKRLEEEHVFEFLVGLNQELDDVRGRILRPLPSTRKTFSEVRREENRRKVMLGSTTIHKAQSSGPSEGSALAMKGPSSGSGPNKNKNRPWCDHCKKPGHIMEKCWELHGKPADWKPRQSNRNRGYQAGVDAQSEPAPAPSGGFNPEQMEQLYKMFSSFQTANQSNSNIPSGSLAHRGPIIGDDD